MKLIPFLAAVTLILTGCKTNENSSVAEIPNDKIMIQSEVTKSTEIVSEEIKTDISGIYETESVSNSENADIAEIDESKEENNDKLQIEVNGYTLTANFADNPSAQALAELIRNEPLTLELREYGSFEKVGPLSCDLPTNDESITTEPGDIMLYLGNQITIFYGSNTWDYTRLGKIDNITKGELKEIFGDGNVTVTLSISD